MPGKDGRNRHRLRGTLPPCAGFLARSVGPALARGHAPAPPAVAHASGGSDERVRSLSVECPRHDQSEPCLGVIGANIANVATTGFKRTDAHFETLLGRTFASQPGTPDLGGPLTSQSDIGGVAAKDYARIVAAGRARRRAKATTTSPSTAPASSSSRTAPVGSGRRVYGRDGAFASRVGEPVTTSLGDGTTARAPKPFSSTATAGTCWAGRPGRRCAGRCERRRPRADPHRPVRLHHPVRADQRGRASGSTCRRLPTTAAARPTASTSSTAGPGAAHRARLHQDRHQRLGAGCHRRPGRCADAGAGAARALELRRHGPGAGGAPYAVSVAHPGGATSAFSLDLSAFTQVAGPLAPLSFARDGHEAGILDAIAFDAAGTVMGTFTNGHSRPLYRLALADFANPDGLDARSAATSTPRARPRGRPPRAPPAIPASATSSPARWSAPTSTCRASSPRCW